jgi:hypothetical protein
MISTLAGIRLLMCYSIAPMRKLTPFLVIFFCTAVLAPPAPAKTAERSPLSTKIMRANSVYVDCVCPRALGVAQETAVRQLESWGRFQISQDRRQTDLVILFSGNPYLGDYLTRDGPDTRPLAIVSTIMTVIDPNTGKNLWTDYRHWGSWRVAGATKDLVGELRELMEDQTKRWTLEDILMCSVTPVYAGFAHLTAEDALAKSILGSATVSGTPDHLTLTSPDAPAFCEHAEFFFGPEHRILGFEVYTSQADDLEVGEILQHADRFDFSGEKSVDGDQVSFVAQSKDRRLLMRFTVKGHRTTLSHVSFLY